ncbi:hypothetical protein WN51_05280 [Melipona quadrifasciata]|uniref:Uncharacterized protein n=1 Tax=Melipona quadrifasciata TaxID=166423 RepID=A0A0M9AB41_9HYME|nr:hypothetical protein WN51_05280 [Melipona quadrifasciata]
MLEPIYNVLEPIASTTTSPQQYRRSVHITIDDIPTSSKRKRRIIVYGLVTRYGPQSVTGASG